MRDDETGNDYAGARYYANWAGRWLAADSVRGPIADPQRTNRYARNDPINRVDHDGRLESWWEETQTVVGRCTFIETSGSGFLSCNTYGEKNDPLLFELEGGSGEGESQSKYPLFPPFDLRNKKSRLSSDCLEQFASFAKALEKRGKTEGGIWAQASRHFAAGLELLKEGRSQLVTGPANENFAMIDELASGVPLFGWVFKGTIDINLSLDSHEKYSANFGKHDCSRNDTCCSQLSGHVYYVD